VLIGRTTGPELGLGARDRAIAKIFGGFPQSLAAKYPKAAERAVIQRI
jgi:hypothetical protein